MNAISRGRDIKTLALRQVRFRQTGRTILPPKAVRLAINQEIQIGIIRID